MKIKVSSSYTGVIPVAEYGNVRPGFSAECENDLPEMSWEALQEVINQAQKDLQAICYSNFKTVAEAAKIEKIKNDMKGFRFYPCEVCNTQHPSVTTILCPDYQAYVSEDELRIAIAEGNIAHARAAHFIQTGEWIEPKEIAGIGNDLLTCKGRFLDAWNFPGMVEKCGIKSLKNGNVIYNHEAKYAGTFDAECMYPLRGEKEAEEVPTLIDFKRTPERDKNFTQIAAYAKCEGMEHIKQMMVIQTNIDTQQGWSKPLISTAIDKYFEVFQAKRAEFLKNYNV